MFKMALYRLKNLKIFVYCSFTVLYLLYYAWLAWESKYTFSHNKQTLFEQAQGKIASDLGFFGPP